MYKVLFVCSGNTCRSPIARGMFEAKKGDLDAGSASCGLSAFNGDLPNPKAVEAAKAKGVDITDHLSATFGEPMVAEFDLILTMTKAQRDNILIHIPDAKVKTYALAQFAGEDLEAEFENISDPYGMDEDAYAKCADQIEKYIEKAISKIKTMN